MIIHLTKADHNVAHTLHHMQIEVFSPLLEKIPGF